MSKFVTCGKLKLGTGYSDIVCDVTTGDLIFCDDANGNCLISGIPCVPDPFDVTDSPAIDKIITQMECDGAILTGRYLITFNDFKAEFRNCSEPTIIKHSCDVDFNIEYDEPIE